MSLLKDFTYHSPTEVVFGKDAHRQTASLIRKYSGHRVLVVYGRNSVVQSGLLTQITDLLEQDGIAYETHGGVTPNPIVSHVQKGIEKAMGFGADFILAIGGGSVIDEAKAIAHGTKNGEPNIWKYWMKELELHSSLPVGAVLTISAAGSETSDSAVLTNDANGQKRGLNTELNRPRFAVMNPELTYTLPKYQIACGIVDILMHTLDRYFTTAEGNQITDEISEAIMRTVIKNGLTAINEPGHYDAMSELMWCGSLSHNGLTGLGRPRDFSVHALGHELSGRFNAAHGASLSAVWGAWAKYCYKTNPGRFARLAKVVWNIENSDVETAAIEGISATVKFFETLEMPVNLPQLGVGVLSDDTINEMSDSCVFFGKRLVGNFRSLNKEDVANIYRSANIA